MAREPTRASRADEARAIVDALRERNAPLRANVERRLASMRRRIAAMRGHRS